MQLRSLLFALLIALVAHSSVAIAFTYEEPVQDRTYVATTQTDGSIIVQVYETSSKLIKLSFLVKTGLQGIEITHFANVPPTPIAIVHWKTENGTIAQVGTDNVPDEKSAVVVAYIYVHNELDSSLVRRDDNEDVCPSSSGTSSTSTGSSSTSGYAKRAPTCPDNSRATPPSGAPKTQTIVPGKTKDCYGACGGGCNCNGKKTTSKTTSTNLGSGYTQTCTWNIITCNTQSFCRFHDSCYVTCYSLYGCGFNYPFCKTACDSFCVWPGTTAPTNHSDWDCVQWALGASGNGASDGTLDFYELVGCTCDVTTTGSTTTTTGATTGATSGTSTTH